MMLELWLGFEPRNVEVAAPCLSHLATKAWWEQQELNLRPKPYQDSALPIELCSHVWLT